MPFVIFTRTRKKCCAYALFGQASYLLGDVSHLDLCHDPHKDVKSLVDGRLATVMYDSNCTLCELADTAQANGAAATVILLADDQLDDVSL